MRKKTQPAASRTYSIKTQSVTLLTSGLILLIALLLFSNLYGAFDSNKKIAASNERTLTYTAAQIEDNLSNVNNMMLSILSSNTGLQTLTAGTDSLNAHTVTQELVSQFQRLLRVYPFCDAFFVCSTASSSYRDLFRSSFQYDRKLRIREWLENTVRSDSARYSDGWITHEIDGEPYLIRFYGGRGTYLAALCSFPSLADADPFPDDDAKIAFCGKDGSAVTPGYPDLDLEKVLRSDQFVLSGSPRRMILHRDLSDTDVTLLLLVSNRDYVAGLSPMQIVLLALSLLTILLIPLELFWIHRLVTNPLNQLESAITEIRKGNLEVEIPASTIVEFQEVGLTFNEMTRQIRNLKIEAYENELATQRAQLQYLQLQIRPHFYLNCLKGLYAVAQQQDVEKLQKIILSISGHLRYMFQDQLELVTLRQEIEHIRNYIDIQNLCIAHPPECRIDVPRKLENFLIPPLSLSTFVENSFKHRGNGQAVIHVKAAELNNGDERFLDLTVQDNGDGFSEQTLKELSKDDQTMYATDHVGIRNIRQRFRLIYGKEVLFAFYNTPQGPVSEILIPLSPKKKEEEGNDDDSPDRR